MRLKKLNEWAATAGYEEKDIAKCNENSVHLCAFWSSSLCSKTNDALLSNQQTKIDKYLNKTVPAS